MSPSHAGKSASSSKKKKSVTTGVLDFLHSALPRKELLKLYMEDGRGQFVCRAVLQQLLPVSQQVVMRLQCTGGIFPVAGVQVWTCISKKQQGLMLKELHKWAIIQDYADSDANNGGEREPNYRSRIAARQFKAADFPGTSHFSPAPPR